jgi:hypothetical protein
LVKASVKEKVTENSKEMLKLSAKARERVEPKATEEAKEWAYRRVWESERGAPQSG